MAIYPTIVDHSQIFTNKVCYIVPSSIPACGQRLWWRNHPNLLDTQLRLYMFLSFGIMHFDRIYSKFIPFLIPERPKDLSFQIFVISQGFNSLMNDVIQRLQSETEFFHFLRGKVVAWTSRWIIRIPVTAQAKAGWMILCKLEPEPKFRNLVLVLWSDLHPPLCFCYYKENKYKTITGWKRVTFKTFTQNQQAKAMVKEESTHFATMGYWG